MSSGRPKVLCAMSGGVDSSVAAALLLEQGYDVIGCFMRLGSPGEDLGTLQAEQGACAAPGTVRLGHQGCCSVSDAADARLVAAKLGIPFYVCNFKAEFGRIMDYFVDEYTQGRTPNPCVRCNDWLKFGKLHDYAGQVGAAFIASGHYARVGQGPDGRAALFRGLDEDKDQSYVLFGVPRDRLDRMLLPIGGMRKSAVRERARQLNLPVFNKPDSQEICFVPDNDYAGFVARQRQGLEAEGDVLDASGAVVGRHKGQHRFTIGQRRGVGTALGYPVYVVDKSPERNTVTVGPREMLLADACTAAEANWLTDAPAEWTACRAKIRYNSDAVPAMVRAGEPGSSGAPNYSGRAGGFEVRFDAPLEAVTPGQAIVLYAAHEPERVLGGGWISGVCPTTGGAE